MHINRSLWFYCSVFMGVSFWFLLFHFMIFVFFQFYVYTLISIQEIPSIQFKALEGSLRHLFRPPVVRCQIAANRITSPPLPPFPRTLLHMPFRSSTLGCGPGATTVHLLRLQTARCRGHLVKSKSEYKTHTHIHNSQCNRRSILISLTN